MAFFDLAWYVNAGDQATTGYYALAQRPQNTAVAAGIVRRQFTAPAVGSERAFVCIVAGTTANVADATWVITRGGKTTDGTATWQECTGQSSMNGDLTNTVSWAEMKAISSIAALGTVIKRNSGASYQIASTAGTVGASEPAFSNTAGTTTVDGSATWTSLGPVANFTAGMAPHARLASAFGTNWFQAGNTVYVGDNHAESQASAISLAASSAAMARIISHNHSGSYPPASGNLMAGASVATTGASGITLSMQGSFYFYGLSFKAGTSGATSISLGAGAVGQVQNWYSLDNCSLQIGGTTGGIQFGAATAAFAVVVANNVTIKFGAAAQTLLPINCQLVWQNTGAILVSGSAVPATLFVPGVTTLSNLIFEAVDLSQLTGNLFSTASNSYSGSLFIKDCKLNASLTSPTLNNTGIVVQLVRSSA